MRKITMVVLLSLMIGSVALAGVFNFNRNIFKGSGKLASKTFQVSDFNKIDAGSTFKITVKKGDEWKVVIKGDDNILEKVKIKKSGKTLYLCVKIFGGFSSVNDLEAEITMPELVGLDLSGATKCNLVGIFKTDKDVEINVSGISTISGVWLMKKVEINCSGAAHIDLEGEASYANLDCSGVSSIDIKKLYISGNVNLDASGCSNIALNFDGNMSCEISGCSNLKYKGDGVIKDIEISGSGGVEKM